jgi:hypothetical protein
MSRRGYLVVFVMLAALAAGAAYYRYRVNQAVADCAMPAPPEKPATPPPNLPGFQTGAACGPGEQPSNAPANTSAKKAAAAPDGRK